MTTPSTTTQVSPVLNTSQATKDQLLSYVQRIEKLSEEKDTITQDISEIYSESRGNGYCPKTIKQIVKIRAKDPSEVEEEEAILELYKKALGMI